MNDELDLDISSHKEVRDSKEYQAEITSLSKTVQDFIHTLHLANITASRWKTYDANYLLPRHFDDLIEALIISKLAIENGALNPARRELRYILEVAVNISMVDEVCAGKTLDERVEHYKSKRTNKINVDHIQELPLRLLGVERESFAMSVKDDLV